jgi:peptide/nickel transport system permease protein
MVKYLIKRLILFVIVIFGVVTITFFISHVIPADPVGAILGENAPQELVEKMERQLGLDLPLGQQYTRYLKGLINWNFGISLRTQKQVSEDLRVYFPATIELALLALFIAIIFGISIGVISAVKRNQWQDNASRVFSLVGISMPAFWLGLLFILILYYHLGLIPAGGRLSPSISPPPMVSGLYLLDSLIAGQSRSLMKNILELLGLKD